MKKERMGEKTFIPDVSAAVSEETTESELNDSFYTAIETPGTPEGLKPRRSIDDIRRELKLPPLPSQELKYSLPSMSNDEPSPYSSYPSKKSSRVAESPDLLNPMTQVGALIASQTLPPLPPKYPNVLPPRLDDELPYQRLNDSLDIGSPPHAFEGPQYPNSPTSTRSSSVRTPAWKYPSPAAEGHSQIGLVEDVDRLSHYNFDPIDRDVALDAMTTVSAISASTHGDDFSRTKIQHRSYSQDEDMVDDWAIQRKRLNQRKQREKLVLEVVERLQDDFELVHGIEEMDENDGVPWFEKTPKDQEGILTGYTEKTISCLRMYCKSLMAEMDTARPEEFFLSPSQMESFGETHNDLRHALHFLLRMLRSRHDEKTWKCKYEVKMALGMPEVTPDSPGTVRGGDTSLFSLPSESSTTPHTSNVSMATTITTKLLSPLRSSPTKANNLRRTIEIVSTLLNKMTQACKALIKNPRPSSEVSIRATEEVKRVYMQLMNIRNDDLINVVDAFFLNRPHTLIRTVSAEEPEQPLEVLRQQKNLMESFSTDAIQEEDDDSSVQMRSNAYDCSDIRESSIMVDNDDNSRVTSFYTNSSIGMGLQRMGTCKQ